MADESRDVAEVLRDVWTTQEPTVDYGEDCSNTKVCRNMKDVTFDGFAEPGSDLSGAWRDLLAREGKSGARGQTVHDLIFGGNN